ncbi:Nif3-like dinuclear metal center hexameric protein [Treponema sp.]
MTTKKLSTYFHRILDIASFVGIDDSLNGLQVDNDGSKINKVAFATDACMETFERAAEGGAGCLFVHHGLFWGKPLVIKGALRKRLAFLFEKNIALFAVHLPLDQDPLLGNNAALADLLGMQNLEPFGLYHGKKIGFKGTLAQALSIEEAVKKISFKDRKPAAIHPFGPRENITCAVVSGGAAFESLEAIDQGIDLYVTGEASHSVYHHALEAKLNMIAGGHYSTEVWGVRRVMAKLAEDTNLEVEFIDAPTGL